MRYSEIVTEEEMLDVLQRVGGYSAPDWHNGFWIDDEGYTHECDYENDVHHADLVAHMMTPEEEPIQTAMREGWVRVRIVLC